MSKDIRVRLYSNSKQFNAEMSSISRQMRVAKSEFEASRSSVENWGNKLKQSEIYAKHLNKNIELQKRRVSELRKAYNDSAQTKGKDAKETQNLAIRLNRATAELGKMQGHLKKATADLRAFGQQQGTKKLQSDLKSLDGEMKRIDTRFDLLKSSSKNFGNEMKQTSIEVERLKAKMSAQGNIIKRLEQEYKKVWSEKKKNTAEARQLSAALDQERIKFNNLQNSLTQTTTKMKQLNAQSRQSTASIRQYGEGINNVGMKMRTMGMSVGIVSGTAFAGLVAPMKAAFDATKNFEFGMSAVQAVSGATGKELGLLRGQAKELGESTMFSASQAAEGMEKLALAGWKTKEIMAGMPGMLDLAAAGNLELAEAADITSDTMAAFGMEADKAGHAADVFAYAQANANTNVSQMGEAMKYAAPVANALGWGLEETGAAMMKLADSGIKGSLAGQAFATSLARLAKPTKAMKGEMKRLGMEFFDTNGNMKPLPKVMQEIEKGTKGMTKEQKSATLTTLFGAQAYKHWAILLEAGSDSLGRTTEELKNAEGAAAEMAKTMQDNVQGKITAFKSAVEGAQIALMEKLSPALMDVFEKGTELVRGFTSMDDATQKTVAQTALLTAGVLAVTTAVAGVVAAVGAFLAFAGPVGLAITGITAGLGLLGIGLFAANQHTKNLKEEQEKAHTEALRYGDGLSEGTKKGVQGYVDLYEGAKVKMLQLKNMSEEEAEKTSAEVVKAFSEMADKVITELETQKEKLTTAINEVYGIAGDAGKEKAEEMTNRIIEQFDKDVAEYKRALDTVKEAHEKYQNDMSKMPADFAEKYQYALDVIDGGTREFAKSYDEMRAIQKNISERDGKIMFDEAQKFNKQLKDTYDKSLKAANSYYVDKQGIFEQALAQRRITQEEYDVIMLGVEARTNEMMTKATEEYQKSTVELTKNLDERGKLLDIATGKEFERISTYQNLETEYGTIRTKMLESDGQYYHRWQQHTADVLKSTQDFSEKTKQVYQDQLQAFLESTGLTTEEAKKMATKMVEDTLTEMQKGDEEAKESGKKTGESRKEGLEETIPENEEAAEKIVDGTNKGFEGKKEEAKKAGEEQGGSFQIGLDSSKTVVAKTAMEIVQDHLSELRKGNSEANQAGTDKGESFNTGIFGTKFQIGKTADDISEELQKNLEKGKPEANKSGADKGTEHSKGLTETLGKNLTAGAAISDSSLLNIGKGSKESEQSGKNKGDSHKKGLIATLIANTTASSNISKSATSQLGATTDGGGGNKAGSMFQRALSAWRNSTKTAGENVAKSGRSGLKSVSTSGAGDDFVAGFRRSIAGGSVWDAAWSLGKSALKALRSSINTASPSKDTAITGNWFTQGFEIGISKNKKKAIASAKALGKDSLKALNGELTHVDRMALLINTAAKTIRAKKDVLKVQHEINSGNLIQQLSKLLNKQDKNEKLEQLLEATLKQNDLLMRLIDKDLNIYLDRREFGQVSDEYQGSQIKKFERGIVT